MQPDPIPGTNPHSYKGLLVTFEGGDGSGKKTQTHLTYEWLKSLGLDVEIGGFPMYDTPTGKLVASYLNGEMGTGLSADEAGKLYQNDRLANKGQIIEWLRAGKIVLLDRYVESNSGHQGGKLPTRGKRIEHVIHNAEVEYGKNGLPVPDVTLLFTLPPELAKEYVARKSAESRTYTTLTHDIHEADADHLKNANEAFSLLPELYPNRFILVPTTNDELSEMLPKPQIQIAIQVIIRPLLIQKGYKLIS